MVNTLVELADKGRSLALEHQVIRGSRRTWMLELQSFSRHADELDGFCRRLRERGTPVLLGGEEWLVDHTDFIAEQVGLIRRTLQPNLGKWLPTVKGSYTARFVELCHVYVDATDGTFAEDSFIAFVNAYQEVLPIALNEAWLLPFALRMAMILRLCQVSVFIGERRDVSQQIDAFVSRLRVNPNAALSLHANASRGGKRIHQIDDSGLMLAELVTRVRRGDDDADSVRAWLLNQHGNDVHRLDGIVGHEHRIRSAYQVTIGNIITSLRTIGRIDWRTAFVEISMVDRLLTAEETGLFSELAFSSQDTLRRRVETLARQWHVTETVIAQTAVDLANGHRTAREPSDDAVRPSFVAYYLNDARGAAALRRNVEARGLKPSSSIIPGGRSVALYFVQLAVMTLLILFLMTTTVVGGRQAAGIRWMWAALAAFIPASEWAVAFIHWMTECTLKPAPLLRFDYSKGIPTDAATMVVIPVIWTSTSDVNDILKRLERHHIATRDPNVHYAILGDFSDANKPQTDADRELIATAVAGIHRLNHTYGDIGSTFHLFHRSRLWNDAESCFMGWERKRGKLVEFVELLRGSKHTSYQVVEGDPTILPEIRYVVTLDADTQLPMGTVQRMVATMHLPYNRPRLNTTRTRVLSGYGILQPRVAIRHSASRQSLLARLWSGNPGVDPYAFAVSDPYQDAFGEGIFTGKGIFDVDSFHQVICPRIPDNRVLSHDLLEGGFLRAGLLSDVEVLDDFPATYASYQQRLERWVRGDWQLLPWLAKHSYNRYGERQTVDLSPLTKWQIIDNMRRSVLPVVLFVVLLLGFTVLPGKPMHWFTLVFLTLAIPLIRHCSSFNRVFHDKAGLCLVLLQTVSMILFLPVQAALLSQAIGKTIYRMAVSKRNLLEWMSSREVDRREKSGASSSRVMAYPFAFAWIVLWVVLCVMEGKAVASWVGAALGAVWTLAPVYAFLLSRPLPQRKLVLTEEERQRLFDLARRTWSYYEAFAGETDHHLPPDNVQVDPPVGVAHRTSPTNIGMLLTAYVAAVDLGFTSVEEAVSGIRRTVTTIESLEKWCGHLFNWYDTRSLEPLLPKYVSTVDSGNLVVSMIVVEQALLEWCSRHDATQCLELAGRVHDLAHQTDFRVLYDQKAGLLSLGYHVEQNRRETILYDLFASENRQASYVGIAFGQLPVSHWFALNRTLTQVGRIPTLLSWSATMFEYLMPALCMRTYRGSLWDFTYRGVIRMQRAWAKKMGVPFGISESGYYAFDAQMNYQYHAFGVPGLGFKRGLEQELVVAPYAAVLALPFSGADGLNNLWSLEGYGAAGQYGLFEAIDWTARRMPAGTAYRIVKSYMAHHQGMTLLTLTNVLCNDSMIRRFHASIEVEAAELLLQERLPKRPRTIPNPTIASLRLPKDRGDQDLPIQRFDKAPASREVCLLAAGDVSTWIATDGSGYTKWHDRLVNRWTKDPFEAEQGQYVYLKDLTTECLWSPLNLPLQHAEQHQEITFYEHMAVFEGALNDLHAHVCVTVSPECLGDLRTLTLTNRGTTVKRVEVTSFLELAMAKPEADQAHPAFSKLFVRTAYDDNAKCLVAERRPRSESEAAWYTAHALVVQEGPALDAVEYETNRATFIGRGRTLKDPHALGRKLNGSTGAVADPAFSMRQTIEIEPNGFVRMVIATTMNENRQSAVQDLQTLCQDIGGLRTMQFSWNFAGIERAHVGISTDLAQVSAKLAARLTWPSRLTSDMRDAILLNGLDQSGLWGLGISGNRPILLVHGCSPDTLPFVTTVFRCHQYLQRKGYAFDIVALTTPAGGYRRSALNAIEQVAERFRNVNLSGNEGLIRVLAIDEVAEDTRRLLQAAASVILHANDASLKTQLQTFDGPNVTTETPDRLATPATSSRWRVNDEPVGNGMGQFIEDGRAYRIVLRDGVCPPLPWSNVMANPTFGTLMTDFGTGYTWWHNSREFKLTPWRNDPVLDKPSEFCFIRDENALRYWSATPQPGQVDAEWEVTHSFGVSRYQSQTDDVNHHLSIFASGSDSVKIGLLSLTNQRDEPRTLSVTYATDLVLGVDRDLNRRFVIGRWMKDASCMLASNTLQSTFRNATVILGIDGPHLRTRSWTVDKEEFFGTNDCPGVLKGITPNGMAIPTLSCREGPVANANAVVRATFDLAPLETTTVVIVFGCAESEHEALSLWERYRDVDYAVGQQDATHQKWLDILGRVQVQSNREIFNAMMNGWLLYQVQSCRLWARTGFYQAGGAFGFRDQLQDAISLLHADSTVLRHQILLHAGHQFEEGDVQHWWHEETQKGIRTRFSDDLLWLPYAVGRYVDHTGHAAILSDEVPYLTAPPLDEGQDERYGDTVISQALGTIYDHCVRAVDRSLRFGEHGLPLMGSGDWNDGMSLVGPKGRGESVWLGWFLCDVLLRMEGLAEMMGDAATALRYGDVRAKLCLAINDTAWDGQWYRRAFTDAGTWLGSAKDIECQIDAIAQAWSVISGAGNPDKQETAMQSVLRQLVDPDLALIRLLTPPFDTSEPSPGYIQGYPPGLRENGGQYTHGVVWVVMAFAMLGETRASGNLFDMLLPGHHATDPAGVARYQGEPYVMAADIYAEGPLRGRAGWTWYTGAAGWMYQVGLEWLLGIQRRGNRLILRPCLSGEWGNVDVAYHYGSSCYNIHIEQTKQGQAGFEGGIDIMVDGKRVPFEGTSMAKEDFDVRPRATQAERVRTLVEPRTWPAIALVDDGGTHEVRVVRGDIGSFH